MLNDLIQSLLPAIYPILKTSFDLSFAQIGYITLAFQLTASLLQPVVGLYTDRRPVPYSLPVGMGCTLLGLLLLSVAGSFPMLLLAAGMVGLGSSVFHPEAARVARAASGGRYGLAQSVFQVGGNGGAALGPLAAAFVVLRFGQGSIAWFSGVRCWRWRCFGASAGGTRRAAGRARWLRCKTLGCHVAGSSCPSRCWWRCCSASSSTSPA